VLREEFWSTVNVTGSDADFNAALERANRVADYMEFGEMLARDALTREESCGGHFRTEHQTAEGEARRDDSRFCHVAAWDFAGVDKPPVRHEEPLVFESVKLAERSYK
jgi:succinate dehydrogenase / fumarate reductase flavoprotein subunit